MTVKSSDPPAGQDPTHSHDPPPSYQASTTDTSSTSDPSSPPLPHRLPPSNIYPNIQPYPALPPPGSGSGSGSGPGPMHHSPSFGHTQTQGAQGSRGYSAGEQSHLHPCPHPAVHYQQQTPQQQLYRPHPHQIHTQSFHGNGHGHARPGPEDWTPPATDAIARARARRRFFVAFCWGLLVYLVLGSIIGTSQVDIHNSHNRKYHPHPYSDSQHPSTFQSASRPQTDQAPRLPAGNLILGDFPSDDMDAYTYADGLMATTPLPLPLPLAGSVESVEEELDNGSVKEVAVEVVEKALESGREGGGGWLPSF